MISTLVLFGGTMVLMSSQSALALDKVVVSANRTSSNLPYFIAEQAGFFKKYGIAADVKPIIDNSLVIAAMIGDQIEAAAAVLAIDGMNANLKKPGTVNWIAMNAQNDPHRMEQFVIRSGFPAKSLADLKGARIVSAPGLGNLSLAKAALAKAGLKEGDYQLDPMDPNQHINVLTSGQYDAAYTLEPGSTIMRVSGVATVLQSGVIASVVLGDPKAKAYVGGAALTGTFIAKRLDVAKRYAQAWAEAVALINEKPEEARRYLIGNTPIPENIVAEMPLILYTMVGDSSAEDRSNIQRYVNFAQSIGALSEKVDIGPYLKKF
jgi:NitT/TauT family transport system substrate-binding protein